MDTVSVFGKNDPKRARMLRGLVLRVIHTAAEGEALNPDDPYAISRDVLTMTLEALKMLPGEAELHNILRYLEGKSYVRVEWLKDGSGGYEWVRILPGGIDVNDGTVGDPGVMVQIRAR